MSCHSEKITKEYSEEGILKIEQCTTSKQALESNLTIRLWDCQSKTETKNAKGNCERKNDRDAKDRYQETDVS